MWQKIKVGQIYKGKNLNTRYVITNKYDYKSSIISDKGIGTLRWNSDIGRWKLIAEYPTWQEAVNSPEFKGVSDDY